MINRIVVFILAVLAPYALASPPVLIGLDAEFGHVTSTSAQAVEQGIRIAIDEINRAGGILNGRKLGACPNFCVNGVWVTAEEYAPRTGW